MSSPNRDSLSQWARWEASTSGKAQKRSHCIDLTSNALLYHAFDGLAQHNSGHPATFALWIKVRHLFAYTLPMTGNRVHLAYWLYKGIWHYQFIGPGLAVLGPVRRTRDPEAIKGIAERGGGIKNQEARLMLDYGINQGKGGMYLTLTDEQCAAIGKAQANAPRWVALMGEDDTGDGRTQWWMTPGI